jgi:LCP family protein required for cell wall assembly
MTAGGGRSGGPDEDDSQYNWLYGQERGGRGRSANDPEPTRMIPQLDRATGRPASAAPAADARSQRPTPAGAGTGSGGSGEPPKRIVQPPREPRARRPRRAGTGRRVRRGLLVLLVAWLAFLVATPLWAVSQIEKVDISPDGERPAEQGGTTYLLVGSDSRRGLSEADNRRLGTGGVGEDIGQRTDTIMLLHTGSGPNLLLSIPRDSIVDVPGTGTTKINAAFAIGGPQLLVQTIEQSTGVRIDDYVEIGFGGFVNAVDAVGGVEVCPRERMVDPRANLRISRGCQDVDGVTALGYSRSRYVSALGDLDRARRQREVISAIGSEVASPWTFLNPLRYWNVNNAARTSLRVSEGTGPVTLARFGLAMTRVNGENGLTCGMPIADQAVNWDDERAEELLGYLRDDNIGELPGRLCTPTGLEGVE